MRAFGRVAAAEFQQLDLRCHALLRDVPVHDVWMISLAGGGAGRTMRDVHAVVAFAHPRSVNILARALFALRRGLGWAHAFVAMALRAGTGGYVMYWAIYVQPVGPLTRLYMALIDPFRRLVVYPALIRETQAAWSRAYA